MASKCFHGIIEREALGNKQKILLCRPEVVSLKQIALNIFNIKLRFFAQSFELRLKINPSNMSLTIIKNVWLRGVYGIIKKINKIKII